MIETDYLIVGQGIAGTLVSHELIKRGKKVLHIDRGHKNTSSSVAAGVANPITGRRFVLKSDFKLLRKKALEVYAELEEVLQITLVQHLPMVRILKNQDDISRWEERAKEMEFLSHLGGDKGNHHLLDRLNIHGKAVWIKTAFKLNIKDLIVYYRNWLKGNELLINEPFDFSDFIPYDHYSHYNGIKAGKVVFCEGADLVNNPFFNFIPLQPSKGQVVIVELPIERLPFMINAGLIIVPLPVKNQYWVGTANKWKFNDVEKEQELEQYLISRLRLVLGCDFKIISSHAAIRPGTKDRKPVMGHHPEYSNLFVFNGLGTKGSSLGPYWASHFVDYLNNDSESIDSDVDISRFI